MRELRAARCGREDCALEVKAVSVPKSNTEAAVKILRVKRCLNAVVVFIFGFLLKKSAST